MKANTTVMLGIRSVGDGSRDWTIESMTVPEALKKIALFTFESTMHSRFQFTLARNREDALIGLGLSMTLKDAQRKEKAAAAADFIDSLFDAPAGGREADEQTPQTPQTTNQTNQTNQTIPNQGLPVGKVES